MKLFSKIFILTVLFGFFQAFAGNEIYAQKVKYSNPEKDQRKEQKSLRKENRLKEKRRAKGFKERGIGTNKKSRKEAARSSRKKDKSGSYLDRVLTDKSNVSEREKRDAYRRDRNLTKSKNRSKFRMERNRIRKKRKPKH